MGDQFGVVGDVVGDIGAMVKAHAVALAAPGPGESSAGEVLVSTLKGTDDTPLN